LVVGETKPLSSQVGNRQPKARARGYAVRLRNGGQHVAVRPMLLTSEGYERLRKELHHLSTVRRKTVVEHLRQARTEGEILTNAGLEDALNTAGFVEGRIQALEAILANSLVIADTGGPRDAIEVGGYATIVELSGDAAPETYRLVGPAEANPVEGSISYESPLGKQLLRRKVGDEVLVRAPDGDLWFRIVAIS
jgi:transcription elongation factor GreA